MTLALSVTVAAMFGAGAMLLVGRDLVRISAGTVLISNAALLFIVASALSRGSAPIHPTSGQTSDPLVQALALTAIVIAFGITSLVLVLLYRSFTSHGTVDLQRIAELEIQEEEEEEPGRGPEEWELPEEPH